MEYIAPKNKKTFTRKPLRRKRLKPIAPNQLSKLDLDELGMLPTEGEVIGKTINEENYNELINRVRYMNTWKQPGYKFTGTIPEPKEPSYYRFND
jgi:hypothetical protein